MLRMKVYVTDRGGSLEALRQRVRDLEAMGVSGVLVSDHLFVAGGGPRREARLPTEPLTTLAAIAALSERLHVGTIVSNVGLLHPALVLRQFVNLAAMVGGERVLAGLGAGWNREEFEALGMPMPSFQTRMQRLEEAAALARQWFDTGLANLEGEQVVARDLPMAPPASTPPRVLLGGGSDRILDIAGRHADALDLNGTSSSGKVSGANLPQADLRRRLSTTVADLERSVQRVRQTARQAGRPADAVRLSVLIGHFQLCSNGEIADIEQAIASSAGLHGRDLRECPYVLTGEAEQVAEVLVERRRRLELDAVILGGGVDPRPFCERVLPRL
jgi:alkanesulfonate monooxygenase SsuD/methylene tetrahydromethanopterin reductase-like flavin-dependent oxidoreductase (luciferase family)